MADFMGRSSCSGRRDGIYVRRIRRPGIDTLKEAVGIAVLILYHYYRGYSYEDKKNCRKIRFPWRLAKKKLHYIIPLSKRHGARGKVLEEIEGLVDYTIRYKRVPSRLEKYAGEVIVGYDKIPDKYLDKIFAANK